MVGIDYPTASIREMAITMLALHSLMMDFTVAEDALAYSRRLFNGCDTDPLWSDGKHFGDCTNTACSCIRCEVEGMEALVVELIQKEGFDVPSAS